MVQATLIALLLAVQPPVPSTPDVSGWTRTASRELEFRTDDYTIAFVGQIMDYQNPEDPHEFVRVYLRHPVVLSERARERSGHGQVQPGIDLRYHVAERQKVLERAQQESEAFIYMHWELVRDTRSGQDILKDNIQYWLLDPGGAWTYRQDSTLIVTELSEPSLNDPAKTQLVGLVFSLGDVSHILCVDPASLIVPLKKEGGDR